MLGMNIDSWTLAGILAFSVTITLLSDWLVAGFKRPRLPGRVTLDDIVTVLANLIWIALVSVFGVLAIRYSERMTNAVSGYLLFAALAFLLSWVRAYLHRRTKDQRESRQPADRQALTSTLVHNLTYLLFASVLYLGLFGLLRLPVDPILFIPLCAGALLPDLDSRDSLPGRLVPWASQKFEHRLGHLEEWHTLAGAALVALATTPFIFLFGTQAWYLIPFGFSTHLLLDMLAPQGIMLLWPLSRTRYGILGGVIRSPGCFAERMIATGLAITGLILLFAVDLGRPEPPPAPTLSYQQTLDRYYSMRGRTQVFAYIDGSWQISGQPISGRFEILNASDQSYIVLNRYSGKIFTAGRTAEDNVYLRRIILQDGPSVLVKPVEIHLEHQPLSDALSILYEMQGESGLQHMHATGDLLLPVPQNAVNPTLQADFGQTSLRKIRSHGLGHYSLHYLSAAELIELADLQVETADLVIVATYARPATGPTVTPLPPAPSATEPAQ
jgi:membrane-bound metal-dependent hydrolase YbcI (DUF457 family)